MFRKFLPAGFIGLLVLCGHDFRAEAQDDHYWAQQFGATGTLMGGAMVGGVNDNSAVFYNPAAFVYPPSYLDSANYGSLIDSYLHVESAARPVLNVGIGYSQVIYKRLTLLLGAFTDFSSYEQPAEVNELLHGFGSGDMYHLSTGLSYQQKKHTISLGFSYAFTPSENVPPYAVINQTPDFTEKARLSAQS